MRLPARNIWDTRLQCVCAVVSARGEDGVELFLSGNFAQATLDPARIVINPNRLYPIEGAIRREGRFAINVIPASCPKEARALYAVRRRQPHKERVLGFRCEEGPWAVPFVPDSLRTLFCEVESAHDTGDHTIIVARVVEARVNAARAGELPLLYRDLTGSTRLGRALRAALTRARVIDFLRSALWRLRPPLPPDLARNTYLDGGQTDEEIRSILRHGVTDTGRTISPGHPPAAPKHRVGLCVVGTGWGLEHLRFARLASSNVDLFACGRNEERTARIARSVGAKGYFVSLERAVADPRVQALSLALPHYRHRDAVETVVAHGKHALVEKPIATTLADADALIAAARRAGVILMVAEDMHFRPAVREAVRAIERGWIGEPLYLLAHIAAVTRPSGWKGDVAQAGGGTWMDNGVHYVRALRLLMGEPGRVFATSAMQVNTKVQGEDSLQVLFDSDFGWQAHMFLSWAAERGPLPDIVVHGEKGILHLFPRTPYFDFYPNAPTPISAFLSLVRPYWLQEKLRRPRQQRRRMRLREDDLTGYVYQMREFLSAVSEARPPVISPEAARRDLEIVLNGYQALESQQWTLVPVASPHVRRLSTEIAPRVRGELR